jgi:hypothetical protein
MVGIHSEEGGWVFVVVEAIVVKVGCFVGKLELRRGFGSNQILG